MTRLGSGRLSVASTVWNSIDHHGASQRRALSRSSPLKTTMNRSAHGDSGESGQTLVLVAIMAMAIMALLALGIDLALILGGQRRFDQNGADSAAMAAGQQLAQVVQPASDTIPNPYFGVTDEQLYSLVRRYAGLQPGTSASGWSAWGCSPGAGGRPLR
jgi:hypothetical protein